MLMNSSRASLMSASRRCSRRAARSRDSSTKKVRPAPRSATPTRRNSAERSGPVRSPSNSSVLWRKVARQPTLGMGAVAVTTLPCRWKPKSGSSSTWSACLPTVDGLVELTTTPLMSRKEYSSVWARRNPTISVVNSESGATSDSWRTAPSTGPLAASRMGRAMAIVSSGVVRLCEDTGSTAGVPPRTPSSPGRSSRLPTELGSVSSVPLVTMPSLSTSTYPVRAVGWALWSRSKPALSPGSLTARLHGWPVEGLVSATFEVRAGPNAPSSTRANCWSCASWRSSSARRPLRSALNTAVTTDPASTSTRTAAATAISWSRRFGMSVS